MKLKKNQVKCLFCNVIILRKNLHRHNKNKKHQINVEKKIDFMKNYEQKWDEYEKRNNAPTQLVIKETMVKEGIFDGFIKWFLKK